MKVHDVSHWIILALFGIAALALILILHRLHVNRMNKCKRVILDLLDSKGFDAPVSSKEIMQKLLSEGIYVSYMPLYEACYELEHVGLLTRHAKLSASGSVISFSLNRMVGIEG